MIIYTRWARADRCKWTPYMTKNQWVTGPEISGVIGPLLITGDGAHLSATDPKNPDMS